MKLGAKIEGGQGGKLGHSNMSHWSNNHEVKKLTKRARREESKKLCAIKK